uniref:chitinase n=1 Tax=Hypocrella siamensis TaxID=696354 RepID=A0A0P0CGE8_9HYPO
MKIFTALVVAASALALGVPPVENSAKTALSARSANPRERRETSSLASPEVDPQIKGESLWKNNRKNRKPCTTRGPTRAGGVMPKDSGELASGGSKITPGRGDSSGPEVGETSADQDAGTSPDKPDLTTKHASNNEPEDERTNEPVPPLANDGIKTRMGDSATTSTTPNKMRGDSSVPEVGGTKPDEANEANAGSSADQDTGTSPDKPNLTSNHASNNETRDDHTSDDDNKTPIRDNAITPTTPNKMRGDGKHKVAVYWGQHGGGLPEKRLADYCKPDQGIDILLLAFLYQWGNGNTVPGGSIGNHCVIEAKTGKPSECNDLAKDIQTCQKAGVKIFLSIGGAVGAYSLSSKAEGESLAENIWAAYGGGSSTSIPRPFGDVEVDGFDFNIENPAGLGHYQHAVTKLRGLIGGQDVKISSAPQCPIPEPNLDKEIQASKFDILWVQFYNNPGCSLDSGTNFDEWSQHIAKGASAGAEIYVGAPAGPKAANGAESGAKFYLEPTKMAELVAKLKKMKGFGGVMMWAAGFSDANKVGGKTYAQQAKCILGTGKTC